MVLHRSASQRGHGEARSSTDGEREGDQQGEYDAEGEQFAQEERGSARPLGEDGLEGGPAVLASHR